MNGKPTSRRALVNSITKRANQLGVLAIRNKPASLEQVIELLNYVVHFVKSFEPLTTVEKTSLNIVVALMQHLIGNDGPDHGDGPSGGGPRPPAGTPPASYRETEVEELDDADLELVVAGEHTSGELWVEYSRDRTVILRNMLIEEYIPLVHIIARRLKKRLPTQIDYDDLVGTGIFGLIEAIEKYPGRLFQPFPSYSFYRIRGAMLDSLRKFDHMSRRYRRDLQSVATLIIELGAGRDLPPDEATISDLCRARGLSFARTLRLLRLRGPSCESHHIYTYAFNAAEDNRERAPDFTALCEDLWEFACAHLNDQDREVIILYFQRELTLKEIGEKLNLTESRISQIYRRILLRLRRQCILPNNEFQCRSLEREALVPCIQDRGPVNRQGVQLNFSHDETLLAEGRSNNLVPLSKIGAI